MPNLKPLGPTQKPLGPTQKPLGPTQKPLVEPHVAALRFERLDAAARG